jgi:hypothetical protein
MRTKVEGSDKDFYFNDTLAANAQRVKVSVLSKGWDYVAVVSGLPGSGKSTFAQQYAYFLDKTFNVDRICFTGKEFREKTAKGVKGQAFILDESFADFNTSLSKDPEFIATINHLQLIRQNNLFLILVLPDYFSLTKNVAIFRSSHLFVPYSEDYDHGKIAVFDREAKRMLYIKGKQFCNYQAWSPNFRTYFNNEWYIDKEEYDKRKRQHLLDQSKNLEKGDKRLNTIYKCVYFIIKNKVCSETELAEFLGVKQNTVSVWFSHGKELMES